MNYNLPDVTQPEIGYSIDIGLRYGKMPSSMLMSKFEETDMGEDENVYDDYARNTLTDRRPDTNYLAHEEPRGGVNQSKGYLNLIHYGHRGNSDDPNHSEICLGETAPDPRGTADTPDIKNFKEQNDF